MAKTAPIERPSRTQSITPTPALATSGWVIEADLADAGEPSDRRFFAVGFAAANEAVEAVLRYPGLLPEDRRFARRPLTPEEISRLRLRTEAVRPYGHAVKR